MKFTMKIMSKSGRAAVDKEHVHMRTITLVLLTVLAQAVLFVPAAHAQWAVFDGSNFSENVAKYALAAQQRMTQLAQFENQVMREEMMYENMMQNALALKDDLHHPLYLVANALTNPMLQNTAAGDVGGALVDGIALTQQTQMDMQASRDAIGAAVAEAEGGGNSYAAQFHAANQLAAVQAEIEMAQAQQQAARLDEEQAIQQRQQQYQAQVATQAKETQFASVNPGQQSANTGESICGGQQQNPYCSESDAGW